MDKIASIDKKDKKILYYLDFSGRMSYSQIGRKTQTSKQLVKYRVERLEKEGIINGYTTIIDTSTLGFLSFRIYLKLKNVTPEKKKIFINSLKKDPRIWAIVSISGKWDLGLGTAAKDIHDFYDMWEKILKSDLKIISEYQISLYSPIFHYSKKYLLEKLPKDLPVMVLGGREKVDVNQKDLIILKELSKNCRIHLIQLSKKVKLTPEATKYRIRRLEKNKVIQGYRALIDISKIGYQYFKVDIRLSDYSKISSIINFCHTHPNIYQVDKTIGGETLEIELQVKSMNHFLQVIGELEKNFPGIIEKYDYFTVIKEEKYSYFPEGLEK